MNEGKPPDHADSPLGASRPAKATPAHEASNPRRCDVRALARSGGTHEGTVSVTDLPRLAASLEPPQDGAPASAYDWLARGESRAVPGGATQTWLHLQARGTARLVCQRCLQPLDVPLLAERSFLFVPDEATAARLDEEIEDDVLVLPRHLDLIELVEDELILALPLVPRHDPCPDPLPLPADELPAAGDDEPHPFAALAALKKPTRPN